MRTAREINAQIKQALDAQESWDNALQTKLQAQTAAQAALGRSIGSDSASTEVKLAPNWDDLFLGPTG